jgi:putative membrane protein
VVAFYGGLGAVVIALLSPLHALGETLFSAHMVQHLVLVLGAAPLLVAGAPALPMIQGVPRGLRRALRTLPHAPAMAPLRRALRNGLVVGGLNALAMWAWHLPALYEAGLSGPSLHALEHASFIGTAVLFWILVMRAGARRYPTGGTAIALVFVTALQSSALGALLAFASRPLYGVHAEGALAWGMTPLADQRLAGLLMWVPAGIVYIAAMAALLLRWLKDMEGQTQGVVTMGARERT